MRILLAPAHYYVSDKRGSEPSWPYYAMLALAKQGHEVFAICGVSDLSQKKIPPNIQLISIFGHHRSTSALEEIRRKIKFYLTFHKLARKIIKDEGIEVVHHFAPISPLSPNFLVTNKDLPVPFTMGPAMKPPPSKADLAEALGSKNDWRIKVANLLLGPIKYVAQYWQGRTMLHTKKLFTVTKEAEKYYHDLYPKLSVKTIPAGIDVTKYEGTTSVKRNPYIILSLSYLIKRKGIDVLLKAFAQINAKNPKARLWIVGNGPEEASLKKLAEELKISQKVRFWGFIDNNNVQKYYAEAGIFVTATRNEPFGQTLLEAMAAGLPVVATKTGGIPDIITKEVGRLFNIDDVDGLAKILDELLLKTEKQKAMSQAAKKRVKEVYSWDVIMKQYVEEWRELINHE